MEFSVEVFQKNFFNFTSIIIGGIKTKHVHFNKTIVTFDPEVAALLGRFLFPVE